MFIVLLGAPGSGKGTQSKRLVERFGLPHLSTGDLLREASRQSTARAREIAAYIDAGRLVSDEMILQLVEERLGGPDYRRGCLLDGVPRTVAQATMLAELFQRRNWVLDHVVALEAPQAELVDRLLARARIEGRADDTPQTISRRMDVYERETAPLLEFYRQRGLLRSISAVGTPEQVFERILAVFAATPGGGERQWR
jgi:adenylate kinase